MRVEHLSLRLPGAAAQVNSDTVDAVVDRYLDFLTTERGRQHSTVLRYRTLYATWLSPRLGRLPVTALRSTHAQTTLNRMRDAGQSTSSIHQAFLVLNGACKWAVAKGDLGANPMIGVHQPSGVSARKTTPTSSSDWVLAALIEAAFDCDHDFGVACVLAAATGMGRGELAGLRWDRVDLVARRIEVCLAINDAGGQLTRRDLTSTTRGRTMQIDDATAAVLVDHYAYVQNRARLCDARLAPEAFVFSQVPDGAEPIGPGYLTRRFRRLTDNLGRPSSDFDTVVRTRRADRSVSSGERCDDRKCALDPAPRWRRVSRCRHRIAGCRTVGWRRRWGSPEPPDWADGSYSDVTVGRRERSCWVRSRGWRR